MMNGGEAQLIAAIAALWIAYTGGIVAAARYLVKQIELRDQRLDKLVDVQAVSTMTLNRTVGAFLDSEQRQHEATKT